MAKICLSKCQTFQCHWILKDGVLGMRKQLCGLATRAKDMPVPAIGDIIEWETFGDERMEVPERCPFIYEFEG
jgi:hypothetical protein